MKNKKTLYLLLILVLVIFAVISWSGLFSEKKEISQDKLFESQTWEITNPGDEKNVNYQASFAIFTNGTFRTFSDSMYHNLSEDVYIESSGLNIVNVKKPLVTWDDFFKTMPFKLTKECLTTGTGQTFCTNYNASLKFYLNEMPDPNALDKVINAKDRLLVSYGSENNTEIEKQIETIPEL